MRIALYAQLAMFSAATLADNHCPRPPGVPAGARYSCSTRTQTTQPGEPAARHPGGSPGRRDAARSGSEAPAATEVQRVRVWINAFIPRTLQSSNMYGRTFRNGPDGRTFVLGPDPQRRAGYLTDQREFSTDANASSRFHAEAIIDVARNGAPRLASQQSWCNATVAIGTLSGNVLCEKSAGNENLRFIVADESSSGVALELSAAAANPCVEFLGFDPAPHIKADLLIKVDSRTRRVQISGKVTQFPAFEAYASVNDGPVQALFRKMPVANKSPWDLYLGPTEPVSGTYAF